MFDLYAEFINKNEKKIIDDFCKKIKKELVGNLTLDEYSRFRFWKKQTTKELSFFHKQFLNDMKNNMSFDIFCELMWKTLESGDHLPEELKEIINSAKGFQIGES